jgi:hypothetical protein
VRVDRDGHRDTVVSGLAGPAAIASDDAGNVYVSQGTNVEVVDKAGSHRATIDGFTGAQGIAAGNGTVLVADVGAHELVAVDVDSGARTVVVRDAPIGQPVDGVVPAAFCPVCPDGRGGFYVGANGDGSIRRVTRGS